MYENNNWLTDGMKVCVTPCFAVTSKVYIKQDSDAYLLQNFLLD